MARIQVLMKAVTFQVYQELLQIKAMEQKKTSKMTITLNNQISIFKWSSMR